MPVLTWYVALPTFQIVGIFHFLAKKYEAFFLSKTVKNVLKLKNILTKILVLPLKSQEMAFFRTLTHILVV